MQYENIVDCAHVFPESCLCLYVYTCTCICNLQSLCRSPDEYFYNVILTPKQTIGIKIYSLPIIIEKDFNHNAISTVSDEYFFSH